jgi:hypothetical protein
MKSIIFWQATCFNAGFLPGLFFDPEDAGDYVPPKHQLTFNRLHGVISQKIELFNWYKYQRRVSFTTSTLMMETEEISETLVFSSTLTRLISREDFSTK